MRVQLTRRLGQNPPRKVIEVSPVEAEWLIDRGHATEAPQERRREPEQAPRDSRSLSELRERAAELGVSTSGSKADVAARVVEAESDIDG